MKPRSQGWISRAWREPLVHFLFAGAVIYLVSGWFGAGDTTPRSEDTITVTKAHIEWLQESWRKRWGRPPTSAELDGLIGGYVKETVLYRKALAMGLDKDDMIIRRRLSQKLEVLVQDLVAATSPTEEDLKAYFAAHRDRYRTPSLHTITQLFFDPDKRGDQTLDDARDAKRHFAALEQPTREIEGYGDRFMLQAYYPEKSQAELGTLFGAAFAKLATGLPVGKWSGPVLSGYGVHLVYVHGRTKSPQPEFSKVREKVKADWQDQQRETQNEKFFEALRAGYKVIIERPDAGNPPSAAGDAK